MMEMALLFMDSMLQLMFSQNFGDTGSSTYYIDAMQEVAAKWSSCWFDPGRILIRYRS